MTRSVPVGGMTEDEYRVRSMIACADMSLALEALIRTETWDAMLSAQKRLDEAVERSKALQEEWQTTSNSHHAPEQGA